MSNEHYLIVSYFLVAFVSLCLGAVAYRALGLRLQQLQSWSQGLVARS